MYLVSSDSMARQQAEQLVVDFAEALRLELPEEAVVVVNLAALRDEDDPGLDWAAPSFAFTLPHVRYHVCLSNSVVRPSTSLQDVMEGPVSWETLGPTCRLIS